MHMPVEHTHAYTSACTHFQLSRCMIPVEHEHTFRWACTCFQLSIYTVPDVMWACTRFQLSICMHLSMCTTICKYISIWTLSSEHMCIIFKCPEYVSHSVKLRKHCNFCQRWKFRPPFVTIDLFRSLCVVMFCDLFIFISVNADHPKVFFKIQFLG